MVQEFDVVCLGGGVAGEAIAVGLQGSGLTLAVVERELIGGENRLARRTRDHRTRIVSDLKMSFDHLRRFCSVAGQSTSSTRPHLIEQ